MAIVGAQFPSEEHDCTDAMSQITAFMQVGCACPAFSELVSVTDAFGFYNIAVIAYWPNKAKYTEWADVSGFQKWWQGLNAEEELHGWFCEVFFPPLDRLESLFSNAEVSEGAAHMKCAISGEIQEHGYWGSMRDRLPISQTDPLMGDKHAMSPVPESPLVLRRRVIVPGKKNLCVIRSGQNWHSTHPEERKLYLETMHPVLIQGMNFLRDHGEEIGCYSCRLMDVVDPCTKKADKDCTFGLAYFDDIASLERWSKEHPTHLAIFGGFLQYSKKLNNDISLQLFHEVSVLQPEHQLFEYVGCHSQTGMMRTVT
jgi:hypothetical protein